MRHRAMSLCAALLALVVAVGPVAAAGARPVLTWLPKETIDFGAEYCGFPVQLQDTFAAMLQAEYPVDRHGNQRTTFTGIFKSRLTNQETGRTTNIGLPGYSVFTVHADGSADYRVLGTALAWYTEADEAVSELDQGIWYVVGSATERYDPDGNLVEATYSGRKTDLCARLS